MDSLILNANNETQYLHIVQCMEKIRKVFPGVILGGF
jgi:hypothetical protein